MVVSDKDVGDNARYTLSLRSDDPRPIRWFKVDPSFAQGHTPVVIRVNDNDGFDYDAGLQSVQFTVVAHTQDEDVSQFLTTC